MFRTVAAVLLVLVVPGAMGEAVGGGKADLAVEWSQEGGAGVGARSPGTATAEGRAAYEARSDGRARILVDLSGTTGGAAGEQVWRLFAVVDASGPSGSADCVTIQFGSPPALAVGGNCITGGFQPHLP